jgi:sec-independent protein translocase protein TatB
VFDIGFSELLLVLVIGLVVLGPERLPVAVRTVSGWIRALRSLAASVQNELTQELKLQELQDSLKKVEKAGLQNLTPELKASMDELKDAAESLKRSYHADSSEPEPTIHNPQTTDPEALHDAEIEVPAPKPAQPVEPKPIAVESVAESTAKPVVETPVAKQPVAAAQTSAEPIADKAPVSSQPNGER